jgi:hypothetical protein
MNCSFPRYPPPSDGMVETMTGSCKGEIAIVIQKTFGVKYALILELRKFPRPIRKY